MKQVHVLRSHDINSQKKKILDRIGYLQYILNQETFNRDKSDSENYFCIFKRNLKTHIDHLTFNTLPSPITQTKKHSVEFAEDMVNCYIMAVNDKWEDILPTLKTEQQIDNFFKKLIKSLNDVSDYIQTQVFGSGMGFRYPYRGEQLSVLENVLKELFSKTDFEIHSINFLERVRLHSPISEEVINIFHETNSIIESRTEKRGQIKPFPSNTGQISNDNEKSDKTADIV